MNSPEINIRGHFAIRQRTVEMFRTSFRHRQPPDAVEILVLDGNFPSPQSFILFLGYDVVHHVLPGPRCQFGISGIEVNPRQAEADSRLAFRFVHGVAPVDGADETGGF